MRVNRNRKAAPARQGPQAGPDGTDGQRHSPLVRVVAEGRRATILIGILLLIVTAGTFHGVTSYDFVNVDDGDYVYRNPHVKAGWTMEGLTWAFTDRVQLHWHPLTCLSHITDSQLFGLAPGLHHLTSLLLHLINSLVLFLLLKRMTGELLKSAFVAALFALHPLHVEAVAWISARKDVLSAFFWILAVWAYLLYSEKPGIFRYLLALALFALGLMAKSSLITLPAVLLLFDYWPLGRLKFAGLRSGRAEATAPRGSPYQSGTEAPGGDAQTFATRHSSPVTRRQRTARRKAALSLDRERASKVTEASGLVHPGPRLLRLVLEKVPFLMVLAASAIVTLAGMSRGGRSAGLPAVQTQMRYVAEALVSYMTYMRKAIWPSDLAIPYLHTDMSEWKLAAAFLILLGVSTAVLATLRRYPYLVTGWLIFLVTLLPVIGIVATGPHTMADRYTYIPLIGPFIMIAWGVPDLVVRLHHRRLLLAVLSGAALLILTFLTYRQTQHWQNSWTLFTHTLSVSPNHSLAYNNLGEYLLEEGRAEESIWYFQKAFAIEPKDAKAPYNIGIALARQGRAEEAIWYFRAALKVRPYYAEACSNIGYSLMLQGKREEAIKYFRKALAIRPDLQEARRSLEITLQSLQHDVAP